MDVAAMVAVDIGDPDSTRTVWSIVALLLVMGVGLVMLAFWLRRSTRPDPEFLAPLELMGERSWRNGDPVWQRRRLDEVRPEGAEPLRRSAAPPRLDESYDAGPTAAGFDDLHPEAPEPEPAAVQPVTWPPDKPTVERLDVDHTTPDERPAPEPEPSVEAPSDDRPGHEADAADPADDVGAESDTGADDEVDGSTTPVEASRPLLDELPDHEIDPDALRRAMDELDAELDARNDVQPGEGSTESA